MAIPAKRNLERLACHYGHSMTTMIEMLINDRTDELLKILNDREQKNFFAQVPSYRSAPKKSDYDWEQKSFYSSEKCPRTHKSPEKKEPDQNRAAPFENP